MVFPIVGEILMFKELTSPIPSWSRYGRTVLWHVEVVEGKGHLGVDGDTGATFIDSGFTFSFATIDEAWDAAQRYYTWYRWFILMRWLPKTMARSIVSIGMAVLLYTIKNCQKLYPK